jgi:hypothetical protein
MFATYVSGSGRWKDAQIDGRLLAVQFDKIDQHQLCPGKNGALVGQPPSARDLLLMASYSTGFCPAAQRH